MARQWGLQRSRRATSRRKGGWLGLFLVFAALGVGCRKLPGPAECQRVAAALLGIDDARLLADPRVKFQFDQQTRDCLLTPYDKQLVRCIDETQQSRRCFFEFQRRLESLARRVLEAEGDATSPVRRW